MMTVYTIVNIRIQSPDGDSHCHDLVQLHTVTYIATI